jgi:hypothetical protein
MLLIQAGFWSSKSCAHQLKKRSKYRLDNMFALAIFTLKVGVPKPIIPA